jgi:hypothetical protein
MLCMAEANLHHVEQQFIFFNHPIWYFFLKKEKVCLFTLILHIKYRRQQHTYSQHMLPWPIPLHTSYDAMLRKARQTAKRNRAAKACARCRNLKSRCSDYRPCSRCKKNETECSEIPNNSTPNHQTLQSTANNSRNEWVWEAPAGPGKEDPFEEKEEKIYD